LEKSDDVTQGSDGGEEGVEPEWTAAPFSLSSSGEGKTEVRHNGQRQSPRPRRPSNQRAKVAKKCQNGAFAVAPVNQTLAGNGKRDTNNG
jgi:hypothetical protein